MRTAETGGSHISTEKRTYSQPRLVVHGSVEKITMIGPAGNNPHGNSAGPASGNPGSQSIEPGHGSQVGNPQNNPRFIHG